MKNTDCYKAHLLSALLYLEGNRWVEPTVGQTQEASEARLVVLAMLRGSSEEL
ncbi:hypothetical protein [Roseivivax marinus]|uniref:hypothetical protein n=1 Tax=Roseivivax marinus TaxID=1379903 RepID=UPI001F0A3738|nr:hypothetical protein [Roseivivax marinus]